MKKEKKGKNNLSRPPQNKNPLYLVVRIIKLNYCHSEKGANTSEKVCVWSNSCQGANTLTPTKAARSAEDYLDFGLKGMLSSSGPVAYALAIFLYLQGRCQPMPPHLCSHSLFFTKGMTPFLCFR